MRLILDTNVLVSALIQRSYPHLIVERVLLDDTLELCISPPLFREYTEVLGRKKFSQFPDFYLKAKALLADLKSKAIEFNPPLSLNVIADSADNRLLELAEISGANFLVTGNTNDFTMAEFKGTKILSPHDYYALLNG